MEFIDNTGHIFELEDYNVYPEGYDYNENEYIFWINEEYSNRLSIDCYYIKPIYIIYNKLLTSNSNINITILKSNHYRLLSSKVIQELLENNENIFKTNDYFELDGNTNFVQTLNKDDLSIIPNIKKEVYRVKNNTGIIYYGEVKETINIDGSIKYEGYNNNETIELIKLTEEYTLIPFYVVANVKEEGTWLTNILIHIEDNDYTLGQSNTDFYCPITVGGVFYDEIEELVINGKNMGINLPKDIIRSFYNSSFYNDTPNLSLWNNKLKEYLVNYMKLYGIKGNYKQILYALDWFGYGDKISIVKLLKTDNELISQYITDNFLITTDIINSFLTFKNTTYISLSIKGIDYDKNNNDNIDFNNDFWGENKPKLIDLFDTYVSNKIDETGIEYIKPYYDFGFNELGLKLSCLKYYYEKYFLPIHINVFRASITNQCFASDIKLLSAVSTHINSNSINVIDDNIIVNFPKVNTIWLSNQIHFIDDNLNEFTNYKNKFDNINNIYYVNDLCFSIPIEFSSKNQKEQYYNVNLLLLRNEEKLIESNFNFVNNVYFNYKHNNERYYGNNIIKHIDVKEGINKYYTIENDKKYELIRVVNSSDYNSLLVYPKLLGENYNIYDWLNSNYTLKMLVNNKWYEYKFNIKMPEFDIKIGKCEYVYNHDMFKQFNGIDENNIIKFNAKMIEPDFVTINHVNFSNNLVDYIKNNKLTYVNEKISILADNNYYYYINKHNCKCIFIIIDNPYNVTLYYILTEDKYYNDYTIEYNSDINFKDNIYTFYDINNDLYTEQLNELIDIIKTNNFCVSIHKNLNSFIDLYKSNINISNINNLLNRVHLFNLCKFNNGNLEQVKYFDQSDLSNEINNNIGNKFSINIEYNNSVKTYFFGDNDSEKINELYNNIFNISTGDIDNNIYFYGKDEKRNDTWINNNDIYKSYDLYLMHDFEYWYVILISKKTINMNTELEIPNEIYKIAKNNSELYLQYLRSDNKFLINRIKFNEQINNRHFNENDTIVCKIDNIDLPINIVHNSKWNFKPLSLGINNFDNISINNNLGIISIGNNVKYEKGYYEIKVTYALDKNQNITGEKTTKILIK